MMMNPILKNSRFLLPVSYKYRCIHSNKNLNTSGGIIDTILHGTQENLEFITMQGPHSKILDHGKHIYEVLFHKVKPDCLNQYMELMTTDLDKYLKRNQNKVSLIGSWNTTVGPLDEIVHILRYDGYDNYEKINDAALTSKDWRSEDSKIRPLLSSQNNELCLQFSFIEGMATPKPEGGIYELRTYALHPGNLIEWATNWRKGLESKVSHHNELIGAWFSQLGPLYKIHHIWHYPSLQDRKEAREEAWQEKDWADNVIKTVKLTQKMESRIMKKLPNKK